MMILCKNCKNEFSLTENEINLDNKLITCIHCNEEWIHETQIDSLENRLAELDQDLYKSEVTMSIINKKHNEKIDQLEKDLKIKEEELLKQNLLEEKISIFEKRITEAEKSNSIQADLEIRVNKIEDKVEKASVNILAKKENIEKKTKYLEMKVSSYKGEIKNDHVKVEDSATKESNAKDVINFNKYEKEEAAKKKQGSRFFWPDISNRSDR